MQQQQYLSNDEELVLELKKGHLCQDVEWVPTLVEQLKDDGLMNRETAASVAKAKKSSAKMKILLATMQKKGKPGHLDKLADILEATHVEKNRWLADAVWNALDMQLKQLKVDHYVGIEAEHIVYEEFSPDVKRMSDKEKRQMQVLLMNRTQIEKNILTNNIEKIMIDGNVEKRQADLRDSTAWKMVSSLESLQSIDGSIDMKPHDALNKMIKKTFVVERETELELDNLYDEQEKSRALMNLQDERVTVDEELSWLLVQHEQNIADLKEQERQLDKDIAEMEQEIVDITADFDIAHKGKKRILGLLEDEVDHFQELMNDQQREIQALRSQIIHTQGQVSEEKQSIDETVRWQHLNNMGRRHSKRPSVVSLWNEPNSMTRRRSKASVINVMTKPSNTRRQSKVSMMSYPRMGVQDDHHSRTRPTRVTILNLMNDLDIL